jgi:hypothetical protein
MQADDGVRAEKRKFECDEFAAARHSIWILVFIFSAA